MSKRLTFMGVDYLEDDFHPWQQAALDYLGLIIPGFRYRIQAPMGAGKTRVVMEAAFRWLRKATRNVVIFCAPSKFVVKQIYNEFTRKCSTSCYISGASQESPLGARAMVCTHSKLQRLLKLYEHKYNAKDLLLIFVECHHDNYYAVANHMATRRFCTVIGESASPWSPSCELFYDKNAFVYKLTQALQDKVICPFEIKMGLPNMRDLRDQAIYYMPTIKEAHISYETDDDTIDRVIRRWRDGRVNPIKVCGMLTEGFDSPFTQDVILKESASPILTYQCFGRGLRYLEGKVFTCWVQSDEIRDTLYSAIARAG